VERLTHLITIVFLNQRNHPVDGRITGRNMLVMILRRTYINEIKVPLLVHNALRAKKYQILSLKIATS
jgi:hypothetical protein